MAEWRPPTSTGDRVQDEINRKTYDALYELKGQNKNGTGTRPQAEGGMTVTARFVGGFTVGGHTYYNMTFKNGLLVGMS